LIQPGVQISIGKQIQSEHAGKIGQGPPGFGEMMKPLEQKHGDVYDRRLYSAIKPAVIRPPLQKQPRHTATFCAKPVSISNSGRRRTEEKGTHPYESHRRSLATRVPHLRSRRDLKQDARAGPIAELSMPDRIIEDIGHAAWAACTWPFAPTTNAKNASPSSLSVPIFAAPKRSPASGTSAGFWPI
jgi:hypothetical protein